MASSCRQGPPVRSLTGLYADFTYAMSLIGTAVGHAGPISGGADDPTAGAAQVAGTNLDLGSSAMPASELRHDSDISCLNNVIYLEIFSTEWRPEDV
ncbi:MAG: hypothetical protein M1834_004321 [Cirrosporium novae-zelandiae]|nr:MAG: hypothetical protein M1834_004321 [Cirrosporium novae-zelandiae]